MFHDSGTGGVNDIKSYLATRFDLHQKIAIENTALNVQNILHALDAGKLESFFSYFDNNASFRFGSQDPINGIENIMQYVQTFLASVNSIQHHINQKFIVKDLIIIIGFANYDMKNGNKVVVPYCDIWKISIIGKILEYFIFCDPTKLFEQSQNFQPADKIIKPEPDLNDHVIQLEKKHSAT